METIAPLIVLSDADRENPATISMRTQSTRRRLTFPCARCGDQTDAVPGTSRAALGYCRACYGKGVDRRPRALNDLSGREWAMASRSVAEYPDTRSAKQREHGACFPSSLAKQQIEIFTKRGETVLDPFAGVGTTLDACADLGRKGVGVELDERFARLARDDLRCHPSGDDQTVVVGDARHLDAFVRPESVDFVLTSPPYGPLLKGVNGDFAYKWQEHSTINSVANPMPYSERTDDLGNMPYSTFLDALSECLGHTYQALRSAAYAVWVVKDFRALRDGVPYVNFHSHLIERAERAGFTLWDIRIYDQTKYRPLVCLGYPSRNFYLNIGHSYLVTLKKVYAALPAARAT